METLYKNYWNKKKYNFFFNLWNFYNFWSSNPWIAGYGSAMKPFRIFNTNQNRGRSKMVFQNFASPTSWGGSIPWKNDWLRTDMLLSWCCPIKVVKKIFLTRLFQKTDRLCQFRPNSVLSDAVPFCHPGTIVKFLMRPSIDDYLQYMWPLAELLLLQILPIRS